MQFDVEQLCWINEKFSIVDKGSPWFAISSFSVSSDSFSFEFAE